MRPSKIKAKLKRDEPVLLTTLHFFDPSVYELTSLMGFDALKASVDTATKELEHA